MFASRIENISASGIRKVFELTAQMEDPINFSIGQPDFDVPDLVKEAAIEAIRQGHNSYTMTQGIQKLRDRIARNVMETRGVEPEGVLVTSGVSGGLLLALLVLVNPGDEVIIPDPYFVMYKNLVHLVGGVPKFYDLYPDFQLRPEKIRELISDKTKIIMVNSPSNPTGVTCDEASLRRLSEIAGEKNILVISDEIYSTFIYDEEYKSIFSYYPNTLLLDGFSKAYGMTGWRMGYAAGSPEILDKMSTLQQFSYVCAPSMAQHATMKVFDLDMTPYHQAYKKKRDAIYQGLRDNGYNVIKPGGSFYIFPQVPWGEAQQFCEAAQKSNMLIIPGSAFSERNTHFRLSFAAPDDKIEQGIEVLARLAQEHHRE